MLQYNFYIISVHLALLVIIYIEASLYMVSDLMKRIRSLAFAGESKCVAGTAEMVWPIFHFNSREIK